MSLYETLARPLLFALDAERAHRLTIAALKYAPVFGAAVADPKLAVEAFGLRFPNPLGLAAGFDKGAEAVDPLFRLGFGFVEIGTVTPRAQPGNLRPRLFRLPADRAVINRFGFNSEGGEQVLARLRARAGRPGLVGVNLGANKESDDRVQDYVRGVETFVQVADYFTINISSPNTPGLRELQGPGALPDLLARVLDARQSASGEGARRPPVLLKIAPDLTDAELDDIVRSAREAGVDGMIVSNTTIARPADLRDAATAREVGGLSGRPLFAPATRLLAKTYLRVEGAFPLVGVGGVEDGATALAKIEAGASLLQLYSALAFAGPGLPRRILAELGAAASAEPIQRRIGRRAAELARQA